MSGALALLDSLAQLEANVQWLHRLRWAHMQGRVPALSAAHPDRSSVAGALVFHDVAIRHLWAQLALQACANDEQGAGAAGPGVA